MKMEMDNSRLKKKISEMDDYLENKFPNEIAEIYKNELKKVAPVDSGRLRNSFYVNDNKILSTVPYAIIQDQGGKIRITERMRGKMWSLYYKTGKELYKNIAITKKSHIYIPPQNYIDKVRDLKYDMQKRLNLKIKKL